jgi:hypothetical protein
MKTKDNIYKKRTIFWGLVLIIMIVCFAFGMTAYYNGEGPDGITRSTLLPITEKFNQLDNVSLYTLSGREFSAKYKNEKIILRYETNSNKYKYKLNYNNDTKLLTLDTTYDNEDDLYIVVKALINAVYVDKGYKEGAVFEKFTMDGFKSTTVNDGISVITDGKNYKIDINLDKDILKSGKEDIIQDTANTEDESQTQLENITDDIENIDESNQLEETQTN